MLFAFVVVATLLLCTTVSRLIYFMVTAFARVVTAIPVIAKRPQTANDNHILPFYSLPLGCLNRPCIEHAKCPPGLYTKAVGNAATQTDCNVCPSGFFKAFMSDSSNRTDSCTASRKHVTCPPGEYIHVTSIAQPKCEACAAGYFTAVASDLSICGANSSSTGMLLKSLQHVTLRCILPPNVYMVIHALLASSCLLTNTIDVVCNKCMHAKVA